MVAVAEEMRADLGEPNLPFAFGDWEDAKEDDLSRTSSAARVVIPQLNALPMRVPRS
jgi:hypothetical protein